MEVGASALSQSWMKGCQQFHKTKQNRLLYGMFYSWFFASFYKDVKISLLGVQLGTHHQIQAFQELSWNYLGISWNFVKIWPLARQLVHSLSGDNNLVPFHLWWKKVVLKREKVSKYFVKDCRTIHCNKFGQSNSWNFKSFIMHILDKYSGVPLIFSTCLYLVLKVP